MKARNTYEHIQYIVQCRENDTVAKPSPAFSKLSVKD